MAHTDFLHAFAKAQGVESLETLVGEHADRYAFQINSRERAVKTLDRLENEAGLDWDDRRVLDVGCAYGAFAIELAKRGARPVGTDVSNKWLRLAAINATEEADIPFIRCDASSREGLRTLESHGPFDVAIVNDVFEHVYDTDGLLMNLKTLLVPGGTVYFKIPNGLATRNVLREGHKGVFGLSLLAPDYWTMFVKAPFSIYYRRWSCYESLFATFGFRHVLPMSIHSERDEAATRAQVASDLDAITAHLQSKNFANRSQFLAMRTAFAKYESEAREDLEHLPWPDLVHKYRITFWEGLLESV